MDMMKPKYWINRLDEPDAVLLSPREILELNRRIEDTPLCLCRNPFAIGSKVPGSETQDMICSLWRGDLLCPATYTQLKSNCALYALGDESLVLKGVVVRDTPLRAFPNLGVPGYEDDDQNFDMFALSTLKTWEKVSVLHTSADRLWHFVVGGNAFGWILRRDIAIGIRSEDFEAAESTSFVTVTSPAAFAGKQAVTMGTRLPLGHGAAMEGCYSVLLPVRGLRGRITLQEAHIAHEDCTSGLVDYTPANIVRLAFGMLGRDYAWSGQWDCSAFICDLHACFGFALPRNTGEQVHIPCQSIKKAEGQTYQSIGSLPLCSLIYMKGHVSLYLGECEGVPYCIHSLWEALSESGEAVCPHGVCVTPLTLRRTSNGKDFLTETTKVLSFG